MIKILQYPDPRLKKTGVPVTEFNDEVRKIIDDMFETLYNTPNCAALAATQLDFEHPKMITVIDLSLDKTKPMCLVNPEVFGHAGEQNEVEGCMSVLPDYIHERVKRAQTIKVKALDRTGKPLEFEAEGYLAKCIQHEVDHLNGHVYLDRVSLMKRQRIIEKLNKIRRKLERKD